MSPLRATLGVIALLMAVFPAGASARQADSIFHNKRLWATVNVCDTVGHPDGIGVRAWMPGTGDRRDELFVRLQVQFLRRADATWHALGGSGDSGFVDVGNGAARVRQSGRTFTLSPPAGGRPAFVLRGLVTFEWRRDDVVERRARRTTSPSSRHSKVTTPRRR